MPRIHIVTDSTAHFQDPDFPRRHNVAVAPLMIQLGKETFYDGVDITTDKLFECISSLGHLPVASAPKPEQFTAVYEEIAKAGDTVLSIHLSSKLGSVCHNALIGGEPLRGRCNIQVIDSGATSLGLGWLVEAAVRAAEAGDSADDIVRLVRGLTQKLYVVFFVETPDYLANNKRFGKAHALLSGMLGVKPFLAIEDGDIVPMEKVRNRQQAVEKLIEFVAEFAYVEKLAILQSTPQITDETRQLLNQLSMDFPGRKFPVAVYGPSLATYLGPGGMGVIVFEGKPDDDD